MQCMGGDVGLDEIGRSAGDGDFSLNMIDLQKSLYQVPSAGTQNRKNSLTKKCSLRKIF